MALDAAVRTGDEKEVQELAAGDSQKLCTWCWSRCWVQRQKMQCKQMHLRPGQAGQHRMQQPRLRVATGKQQCSYCSQLVPQHQTRRAAPPLHAAAGKGQAVAVDLLLTTGASVTAADEQGRTPLHLAADVGHAETVELLLAAGASVAALDGQGSTPLHAAGSEGHTKAVKLLLAAGASVAAADKQGRTPLHAAASAGNADAAKLLLAAGA